MDQSQESMELCMTQLWGEHQYEWSLRKDSTQKCTISSKNTPKPQRYILNHPLTVTIHSVACSITVSQLEPPSKGRRYIKYRDETAVLVLCLGAVCLMMKVTLSYVAHFQTWQDHADWWPGSWVSVVVHAEGRKCGLACWRPVELLLLLLTTVFNVWTLYVWARVCCMCDTCWVKAWQKTTGAITELYENSACCMGLEIREALSYIIMWNYAFLISLKHKLGLQCSIIATN